MERRGTGKVGTETEDKHGDGLEGLWIAAAAAAGGRRGEKGHPGRTIRLGEVVGGGNRTDMVGERPSRPDQSKERGNRTDVERAAVNVVGDKGRRKRH